MIFMQSASLLTAQSFTHQDTLRGSITPQRASWDLHYYDLAVKINPETKSIDGTNAIYFSVLRDATEIQLDLQEPLAISEIAHRGKSLPFRREGNVYWVAFPQSLVAGTDEMILVTYNGQPVAAKNPPWDGGFTWSKDKNGYPFIATSCQGIGASIWWPCKDHMYDEPDSMLIRINVPSHLTDVSNGRLRQIEYHPDGTRTYHWFVSNPINNYGVNANVGRYAHWSDTLHGEQGVLDMDFYVLEDQYEIARKHFQDAHRTLKALEYWFGPYPFYEDGYKLVQVPYLGMEHQSSVTYGNDFKMGYKGLDLSGTGWGLKWDFIIVHETAHEWWANSVTYKDIADMWIHESFANYAEALFTEYYYGKEAGAEYVIGNRNGIENDRPIIGTYDVNHEGSGDMYQKGGNMLHSLRTWLDNDEKWRDILRGMQKEFRHQTVTTQQIEEYMAKHSGLELTAFFNQYLRDTRIPVVQFEAKGKMLRYRYVEVVDQFKMPVKITVNDEEETWLKPTPEWQELKAKKSVKSLAGNPNFYVLYHRID